MQAHAEEIALERNPHCAACGDTAIKKRKKK
jgi:hypothetical protein